MGLGVTKRIQPIAILVLGVVCLALGAASRSSAVSTAGVVAQADACGLPSTQPLWIDYADNSVPFWREIFARPGVIAAAASPTVAAEQRAAGAKSVYFDLNLKYRVGTTNKPLDPALVVARANKLFDAAVAATGCATPAIAENELNGASLPTPWSTNNAQYRANVLTYLKALADRGAHVYLLVSSAPYTAGDAAAWWKEAAASADIVPEVYFAAPQVYKQGAVAGSRRMREAMRRALQSYIDIGIPSNRLGVVLGFQVGRGTGGREGLEPEESWYRVVKWNTLAAKQIAHETPLGSIWSWGWGTWAVATNDPDKEVAACVYLWTRNKALCDGPGMAGPSFDTSLQEGQIAMSAGVRCAIGSKKVTNGQIAALAKLTRDRDAALSALYGRLIESERYAVSPKSVLVSERAIVKLRFGGNQAAYRTELARAGATLPIARGIIGDQLRRREISRGLRTKAPSTKEITTYYTNQAEILVRALRVQPAPPWLGYRTRGYALSALAPNSVFELRTGKKQRLLTTLGTYAVEPLEETASLGALPLSRVRDAVRAALVEYARDDAFASWTIARQESSLNQTRCLRDEMPVASSLELANFLPAVALQDVASG